MTARWAWAVPLLLAGCGGHAGDQAATTTGGDGGAALERAALAAGIVTDPAHSDPTGSYASDTDNVCVRPLAAGGYRVGASVDYGEEQRCVARGSGQGRERLAIDFGAGCRFTAMQEEERLTFPAELPAACQRACVGRASLATLTAGRVGTTADEASRARGPDGKLLCAD